jgi:pSer/pThr/pTyr-binding forkhead associated (FHA) protein
VSLEIVRGSAQNRRREVKGPVFLIGAADDCDLVLADPLFPDVHTYLFVTPAGVSLRFLGKGPALVVNGRTVESTRVVDGDRLRMGGYEFRLSIAAPPTGGGEDRSHLRLTTVGDGSGDWDIGWEQAQMLLCDLPAPLRPLAQPQKQPAAA